MGFAHDGYHSSEQYERLKKRRQEIYKAGDFIRLRGCHVPANYSDKVLDAVTHDRWEVACDQAPYPMLCINCPYIHNGCVCRKRLAQGYHLYGGVTYRRAIKTFTVIPTGVSYDLYKLTFEIVYEDDENANKRFGYETFKRWSGQHSGSSPRHRPGVEHTSRGF